MYTLQLTDGSSISNLTRINPSTFSLESNDPDTYWQLSDSNLEFATLLHDNELEEVLMDYTLQNYSISGGTIRFRIAPLKVLEDERKHQIEKERKRRRDWFLSLRAEKEMGL